MYPIKSIKNFYEYIDYFHSLAASSSYFKFFQTASAECKVNERLLNNSHNRIDGPLMFLEWPFTKTNDYGSLNTLPPYTGAFVILENADKDDWEKKDEAMGSTYNAAMRVLTQMKIDNARLSKRFLYFDLNLPTIDPFEDLMTDQWYGWRCEFTVIYPLDIALDPDRPELGFWIESDELKATY